MTYAEDSPGNCAKANSGLFLVRHTPAPYYTSEADRCPVQAVPLGTATVGPLRSAIDAGDLPNFAFVTPNACNDMHGALSCMNHTVGIGDAWLRQWIPILLAGPDYRAGRLVIMIVWDEGTAGTNHIPHVVIAPGARGITSGQRFDHCSTLRTVEDLLALAPIGCAASASSMVPVFRL
jgi:hypothetical protein